MASLYNHKNFVVLFGIAGVLAGFVLFGSSVSHAKVDLSADKLSAALSDLARATGQRVNSKEEAARICDQERYFAACAEVGKKYGVYEQEEMETVDGFVAEIKGEVSDRISQCRTTECLIEVANNLASKVNKNNPNLASRLELTPKIVESKQAIITAAKELGVDYEACRNLNPDTAPVDVLRGCARLAKDSRVQESLPPGVRGQAAAAEASIGLRESFQKGELQCGGNTLESCGEFCLSPSVEARAQGTSAIPAVCRQIAQKFFGPEGVNQLESAYQQVQQTHQFYKQRTENLVFTTIDGRTLTRPEDIGRYMEEQGGSGNVEAVEKGMDFMVANGFVKPEEKEFALRFVRQARDRGGIPDFDKCASDPASCREFIPSEHREEFEAGIQVQQIMTQEFGFDPRQCQNARNDPSVRQRCFEGSKNALAKLESLQSGSPAAQRLVAEIKHNISRAEEFGNRKEEFQQVFQQQGGPGGCRSEEECHAYCSNPAHGPECIAFGSKQGISGFRGEEAVQKYQQFNQTVQSGQPFSGQGAFPGFQPPGQGGFIPGQNPNFTQPGPGFQPPPGGIHGAGPSPECFKAIESGDFARAKEVCSAPASRPGFTPPQDRQFEPNRPQDNNQQRPQSANPAEECSRHGGAWDAGRNFCRFEQKQEPRVNTEPNQIQPPSSDRSLSGDKEDPAARCAQGGGSWNGSSCAFHNQQPPADQYRQPEGTTGTQYQPPPDQYKDGFQQPPTYNQPPPDQYREPTQYQPPAGEQPPPPPTSLRGPRSLLAEFLQILFGI